MSLGVVCIRNLEPTSEKRNSMRVLLVMPSVVSVVSGATPPAVYLSH